MNLLRIQGIRLFLAAFLIVGFGLIFHSASQLQADPTDDFSFTLHAVNAENSYRLMSEPRVASILRDNLKNFPKDHAPKLARHLLRLCVEYRFDPAFVLSLIRVESGFRTDVVSNKGAVGLMQIQVPTAIKLARELRIPFKGQRTLRDPYLNVTLGIAYLAQLRDRYGFPPHFLAAYNAGPAKMDALLAKRSFKPVQTKQFYRAIRNGMPEFRFYQSAQGPIRPSSRGV